MRRLAAVMLAVFLMLPAGACSAADNPTTTAAATEVPAEASSDTLREAVLVRLTGEVIIPRFRAVASEMEALRQSLHILCSDLTQNNLTAARAQWRAARGQWLRSQALWFGPVMDRRSRCLVDWSPVDPQRIESALADRGSISPGDVKEFLASTQRGMGAVEYLLFPNTGLLRQGAETADDREVAGALAAEDRLRCQYLTALGDVVADEAQGILADWTGENTDTRAYAGYFNGTASSSMLDRAAVAELVRTSVFLTRSITDMQLGRAIGANGLAPDPSAIPGGACNDAVAGFRNQALGMQDVYTGGESGSGLGLSALIAGLSPEADARVRSAFDEVLAALNELEEPLRVSLSTDGEPARAAHASLQELQRTLNTEVVSLLGVSVGFADTDGDGG